MNAVRVLVVLLASAFGTLVVQSAPESDPPPGVKEVQAPFASWKPSAMIKVGETADWVLITDNAVWVASTNPYGNRGYPRDSSEKWQGLCKSDHL
jgi:hypothetical protein